MPLKLVAVGWAGMFLLSVCSRPLQHPPAPKAQVVLNQPITPSPSPTVAQRPVTTPTPTPTPASVYIHGLPYTSQAPYGGNTWSTHEDYCEAAAILMYVAYMQHDTREVIPPKEADARMTQIVNYERRTYHTTHPDLTLAQIGSVAQALFGLKPSVVPADLPSVKKQIAAGHPVIVPVMTHGAPGGQKLAPYYGYMNVYHVILIRGYDAKLLYTNDAGFMIGENYPYAWYWLLSAIDDQTPKMHQGRVMLVLS